MSLLLSKGVYTELCPGSKSIYGEWASQEQDISSPATEAGWERLEQPNCSLANYGTHNALQQRFSYQRGAIQVRDRCQYMSVRGWTLSHQSLRLFLYVISSFRSPESVEMDEIMAAMVLTSLSCSPVVQSPPQTDPAPGLSHLTRVHAVSVTLSNKAFFKTDFRVLTGGFKQFLKVGNTFTNAL